MKTKPYTSEDSQKLEIVTRLFHNLSLADLKKIEDGIVQKREDPKKKQ